MDISRQLIQFTELLCEVKSYRVFVVELLNLYAEDSGDKYEHSVFTYG